MSSGGLYSLSRRNFYGCPTLFITPPGVVAVWLNRPSTNLPASPSSSANPDHSSQNAPATRCDNHERSLSNEDEGPANTTETVGSSPAELLSRDMQAVSLSQDDSAVLPFSSHVTRPTYFELLEGVSVDERAVFLDKCTVMELHSLAATSSALREGAIASMANRSLNVKFVRHMRYLEKEDEELSDFSSNVVGFVFPHMSIPCMYIEDIHDPSRSMSVEFSLCDGPLRSARILRSDDKNYMYRHWPKIQKLLRFCGYARVRQIKFHTADGPEMVNRPNQFAMKADYSSNSECEFEEFFVDELMAGSCDFIKHLAFVSPHVLKLQLDDHHDDDQSKLDAVLESRGITSVESIIVTSTRSLKISDEQMLKLFAKNIICLTVDYQVEYHDWSPADVSKFIEQWLRGRRTIERVIYERTMLVDDGHARRSFMSAVEMGQTLVEELGKLDQPPQIDISTTFDDQLFARLKTILVEELNYSARCKRHFRFSSTVSVIRVTAHEGRVLTIAICRTFDIFDDDVSSDGYDEPRDTGLIYMFPST